MRYTVFSGFDSAWSCTKRGAIASLRLHGDALELVGPEPSSFEEAGAVLARHRGETPLHLVAIDQPLVVPNALGRRPVEAAVAHVVGKFGGGVQPANRGRAGFFDETAPIWSFLETFQGDLDPIAAATASAGRFALEVFPALGNLGLFSCFYSRGAMPKYNPEKNTFSVEDWRQLCREVGRLLGTLGVVGGEAWCSQASTGVPRKTDQDHLDAIICALHALRWRGDVLRASAMIGDISAGYLVVPVHPALARRLKEDADRHAVPFAYQDV